MENSKNNDEIKRLENEICNLKTKILAMEKQQRWKNSITRKALICLITYLIIFAYSCFAFETQDVIFSSLIPVIAYIISTLTLNFIKKS